jgi:hypothetical protein
MDGIAGDTAPYGQINTSIKRSTDIEYNKITLKYTNFI